MAADINQLLNALRRKPTSKIPIMELGVHPKIKTKILGRPIKSLKDEVDFWYNTGYDYVKLQPKADFNPDKIGVEESKTVHLDSTLSYNWASEKKGIITDFKELESYRFPHANTFDYSPFEQAKKHLPDGMGIIGQYGDIFTMTWEMMGFETFSLALFENSTLIDELNNTIGTLVLSMFENMAQNDAVDALWYTDDIAFSNGLLMSPEVLRRYIFPWMEKIGQLAKKHNKPFIYHSDGVLWPVLDDIISCGVDALHPIEPKAMDIGQIKTKYGDRLTLIGHVDVDLLARGSIDEVQDKVHDNIEKAGSGGGYIVGSGNSIPDYVNIENYKAMNKVALEYKV
ncbi:MAG: nucleoside 2-deoxyribosyltransferase [Caldithrix sp.]|nr:nucleoside 2-deoxyribosyltransferase [Caldithrix sp.]